MTMVVRSGPGVSRFAASVTPPHSPSGRSARRTVHERRRDSARSQVRGTARRRQSLPGTRVWIDEKGHRSSPAKRIVGFEPAPHLRGRRFPAHVETAVDGGLSVGGGIGFGLPPSRRRSVEPSKLCRGVRRDHDDQASFLSHRLRPSNDGSFRPGCRTTRRNPGDGPAQNRHRPVRGCLCAPGRGVARHLSGTKVKRRSTSCGDS